MARFSLRQSHSLAMVGTAARLPFPLKTKAGSRAASDAIAAA
jgi:hypothetical protein